MVPPTSATDSKRVALVVGIGAYDRLPADKQLKNSLNDAEGVAAKLTKIGFQVETALNLTRSAFNEKWQDVLDGLGKDDTFVLYFSGHGIQISGQNYLLPRDIPYIQYGRDEQLKRESISLNEILDGLSLGNHPHPKNSIVILDACRDNPLIPPGYKGVSTTRGLAEPPQPDGIFILYAAASNRTALDRLFPTDPVKYSVFTRTLLPLLDRSDLSIQELSNELKDKVYGLAKSAGQDQRPAYYDGTVGRVCLPGCVEAPAVLRLRNQVISQRLSAEARNHLDKRLDLALLLSVEANKRAKTAEALQSLYTSIDSAGSSIFLYGRPDDGYGLTFSQDNKLLVSGSRWGWLQIWDMNSTPPRPIRLPGHGEHIYNLAVSPTNQTVVSNDEKGNVVLWDLSQTPPHPRLLQQHNKFVGTLLNYSSDGSLLASADSNGTLLLYPFNSPIEQVFDLQGHRNPIIKLMFTPDGKTLISGDSAGTFLLWDLSIMPPTQRRRLIVGEGDLQTRTLSPDGKLLANSDSKGHLWVWDLTLDQPQPTPLPGYKDVVNALAFDPNGKKLVAGDRQGTLLVWDLTKQPPRPIPLSTPTHNLSTHGFRKLAFNPNGTMIAVSTDAGYGGFHLWDLKFNPPRPTFHGGHQVVQKLIFSPDGRHLVTADNHGTHLMWHLHDQSPMSRTLPGHQNGIVNVAFTTDGQSLGLVDSVGTCMIWKIDAPSRIQTHLHGQMQAGFEQINFSDDWTKLSAIQSGVPFLWDMTTNPPRSISVPKPSGGAQTVRVSPDGTRLAVGGRDNITLSNLTSVPSTSISLPSHGHSEYIWRLQFSSDSKFLASSDGRDILLWNLKDPSLPKPFRAEHKGRVGNFAFSPDNKHLASGGANGTLLLWDLSTAPPQLTSLPGHATEKDHYVNTVLFSPDGRYLVSSDSMSNLMLWDLKSRAPQGTPLPANRGGQLAAFSPKSDKLVIRKEYDSLSLFNLTGDLSSPIPLSAHNDMVWHIAFSPNGSLISTDLHGETILTWDLETSPPHYAQLWTYQGPTRGGLRGLRPFTFSPTGSTLAVVVGNALLLGDTTVSPPRSIELSSDEPSVNAYAFSTDEKTLAGSYGNQIVFWNVDSDSWVDHACRIANRNLTAQEWSHFLPEEPYKLTCNNLQQAP